MILPAYTLEKKEERERERTEREQREKKEQPKKQIRVPKREKKIFDNHEFSLQKKNWKKKRKKKKNEHTSIPFVMPPRNNLGLVLVFLMQS